MPELVTRSPEYCSVTARSALLLLKELERVERGDRNLSDRVLLAVGWALNSGRRLSNLKDRARCEDLWLKPGRARHGRSHCFEKESFADAGFVDGHFRPDPTLSLDSVVKEIIRGDPARLWWIQTHRSPVLTVWMASIFPAYGPKIVGWGKTPELAMSACLIRFRYDRLFHEENNT